MGLHACCGSGDSSARWMDWDAAIGTTMRNGDGGVGSGDWSSCFSVDSGISPVSNRTKTTWHCARNAMLSLSYCLQYLLFRLWHHNTATSVSTGYFRHAQAIDRSLDRGQYFGTLCFRGNLLQVLLSAAARLFSTRLVDFLGVLGCICQYRYHVMIHLEETA